MRTSSAFSAASRPAIAVADRKGRLCVLAPAHRRHDRRRRAAGRIAYLPLAASARHCSIESCSSRRRLVRASARIESRVMRRRLVAPSSNTNTTLPARPKLSTAAVLGGVEEDDLVAAGAHRFGLREGSPHNCADLAVRCRRRARGSPTAARSRPCCCP